MRPVLIVLDIQNWFFRTKERRKGLPKLIKKTNELIEFFHEKGLPIIHILSEHKKDKSTWDLIMKRKNRPVLIEGTRAARELDEIKRFKTDKVIKKTRHSAFIKTNLEKYLKKNRLDTLVICGVFTSYCVGWTAIGGYERDFNIILAKDAIFGYEKLETEVMLKTLKEEFEIIPKPNSNIFRLLGKKSSKKKKK